MNHKGSLAAPSLQVSLFRPQHLLMAQGHLSPDGVLATPWPRQVVLTDSPRAQVAVAKKLNLKTETFLGLKKIADADGDPSRVMVKSLGPGSAAMGMTIEILKAVGVKEILFIGAAGALTPKTPIGSARLIEAAFADEGVSRSYGVEVDKIHSDPVGIDRWLRHFVEKLGREIPLSQAWTTDAPFRETKEKIDDFVERGAQVVDMETSAALSVAQALGVQFQVIRLVSDQLRNDGWQMGWRDPGFLNQQDKLHQLAFEGPWP